jgi:uncharacterized membrane-anchored protein YhcB (DUF1043 family)
MITGLIGFVLGVIITALVYRNNNSKANAAVDNGIAEANKAKSKLH